MNTLWMFVKAFVVGGLICDIGQLLVMRTKLTNARILVLFVVSGVVLTALGAYKPLADFAGAGATVPLTGFGNAIAKGIREAVGEKGLMGIFSGGFTAASAGLGAAVIAGLAVSLLCRPKDKDQ